MQVKPRWIPLSLRVMSAQGLHFERLDRAVHEARFLEFAAVFRDLGEGGFDRLDMLFSDPDGYFDLALASSRTKTCPTSGSP